MPAYESASALITSSALTQTHNLSGTIVVPSGKQCTVIVAVGAFGGYSTTGNTRSITSSATVDGQAATASTVVYELANSQVPSLTKFYIISGVSAGSLTVAVTSTLSSSSSISQHETRAMALCFSDVAAITQAQVAYSNPAGTTISNALSSEVNEIDVAFLYTVSTSVPTVSGAFSPALFASSRWLLGDAPGASGSVTFSGTRSTGTGYTILYLRLGSAYSFNYADGMGLTEYVGQNYEHHPTTAVASFTDDFNRANGPVGSNWFSPLTPFLLPVISSNKAVIDTTGGNTSASLAPDRVLTSDDVRLQFTVVPVADTTVYVMLRSSQYDYVVFGIDNTAATATILTQIGDPTPYAGANWVQQAQTTSFTLSANDVLAFSAVGNVYTLTRNGTAVVTWTDAGGATFGAYVNSSHREVWTFISSGSGGDAIDDYSVGMAAQSYTQTSTDPVGVTDALALTAGRTATDSVGLTDALSIAAARTQTDAVGISDTLTAAQAISQTLADTLGLTDALASAAGRVQTDSVGVVDAVATVASAQRGQDDSVGLVDAVAKDIGLVWYN